MANRILIEVRSESKLEKCEDFWFSLAVMSRWIGSGAVAVMLLWSAVGCSTVPETGRSQFNLISPSMERAMGRDAFTNLKARTLLSSDQNATAVLQRVGSRIAAVADLPKAQWEFVLFDNSQANAFCLPGGKVGVYTGILQITQTEAGLATVLAHEVAHAEDWRGQLEPEHVQIMQAFATANDLEYGVDVVAMESADAVARTIVDDPGSVDAGVIFMSQGTTQTGHTLCGSGSCCPVNELGISKRARQPSTSGLPSGLHCSWLARIGTKDTLWPTGKWVPAPLPSHMVTCLIMPMWLRDSSSSAECT